MKTVRALTLISVLVASLTADGLVLGHDHSAHRSDRARSVALAKRAMDGATVDGATIQVNVVFADKSDAAAQPSGRTRT